MPQPQSRGYYFSGNSGSVSALEGGWQMSQQGSPGRQDGDYYGVKHGNRQRDRCGPSEQRYMYSMQEFSNHWLLSTDIIRQGPDWHSSNVLFIHITLLEFNIRISEYIYALFPNAKE